MNYFLTLSEGEQVENETMEVLQSKRFLTRTEFRTLLNQAKMNLEDYLYGLQLSISAEDQSSTDYKNRAQYIWGLLDDDQKIGATQDLTVCSLDCQAADLYSDWLDSQYLKLDAQSDLINWSLYVIQLEMRYSELYGFSLIH